MGVDPMGLPSRSTLATGSDPMFNVPMPLAAVSAGFDVATAVAGGAGVVPGVVVTGVVGVAVDAFLAAGLALGLKPGAFGRWGVPARRAGGGGGSRAGIVDGDADEVLFARLDRRARFRRSAVREEDLHVLRAGAEIRNDTR